MTRFLAIATLSVLAMSSQAHACPCSGGAQKAAVLKDVNTRESSIIISRDGTPLKAEFYGEAETTAVAAAPAPAATPAPAPAPVTVSTDTETVKSYRLEFATNATTPNASSLQQIPEIKKALASGEYKSVKIVGFADQTGSVEHNNKLALNRAQEVRKMMEGAKNKNTQLSALSGGVKEGVSLNDARIVEIQLVK